jgi:hypothetical protein
MPTDSCNPDSSIISFPLRLSGTAPTRADYESVMEAISMDFQWAPLTTPLSISGTQRGGIKLQSAQTDTSSSVIYDSTKYNLYSAQIVAATHNRWLLNPSGNTEDLVIVLNASNSAANNRLIIIVIPIVTSTTTATDPAYLLNAGITSVTTTSSYTIGSCFPGTATNSASTIYACYSTCIKPYSNSPTSTNGFVLVATTGLPVSSATMNRIKQAVPTYVASSVLELPTDLQYLSTSPGSSTQLAAGTYIRMPEDFKTYITSTRYLTDTTINQVVQNATQSPGQYKCVELDPENQLDANGNLVIDINKGEIKDQTLTDILAERTILKNLMTPSPTSTAAGLYIGYSTAFLVIILLVVMLILYVTYDFSTYLVAFLVISLLFVGVVMEILAKQQKNQTFRAASLGTLGAAIVITTGFAAYNWDMIKGWINIGTPTPTAPGGPGTVPRSIGPPAPTLWQKAPLFIVIGFLSALGGLAVGMMI